MSSPGEYLLDQKRPHIRAIGSDGPIRKFETGATRDTSHGKLSYVKFLCPEVLERFGQFMDKHRVQKDGSLRDWDNFKQGIPKDVYLDSLMRHVMDVWKQMDGFSGTDTLEEGLCAIMFNSMGLLHEILKAKRNV